MTFFASNIAGCVGSFEFCELRVGWAGQYPHGAVSVGLNVPFGEDLITALGYIRPGRAGLKVDVPVLQTGSTVYFVIHVPGENDAERQSSFR